jgi:hypothetical protein
MYHQDIKTLIQVLTQASKQYPLVLAVDETIYMLGIKNHVSHATRIFVRFFWA